MFQKQKLQVAMIAILFLVVGLGVYANSFNNELFWDDHDGIVKNEFIKDWQYLPKFFTENLIAGAGLVSNYYRPVLLMVYSLEWHAWGQAVYGYHVVNTLVHIANASLIFLLLKKLFGRTLLASLTAFIFLIHPLQTEAVTYVSGLGDPLSTSFIISGLLLFLKFRDSGRSFYLSHYYYLSLLMTVLALLTKDPSVIMPGLIALVDFFYKREGQGVGFRIQEIIKVILPYFAIAGAYIILRSTVLNFQNTFNVYNETNHFTENFHIRLLTFFRVLTIYFSLLFWPRDLHMERSVDVPLNLASFDVILGGLILLTMLVLAFGQIKRYPILSFGIFWFLIRLFPNSNLAVPNSGLLYEHWLYLPMVGIWLIVFWLLDKLIYAIINDRQKAQVVLTALVVIFGIFLGTKTIARNNDWQDPITFYNQTLKYAPESYRVVNNLGMAYADNGRHQEAILTYGKAVALEPSNPVAFHNLANSYKSVGEKDRAIANYKKAIELDPKFLFSYNALANAYLEENNFDAARSVIEQSILYSADKVGRLIILAQIASVQKDTAGVKKYLSEALLYEPDNLEIKNALSQFK